MTHLLALDPLLSGSVSWSVFWVVIIKVVAAFVMLLIAGFLGSSIEVALMGFVGSIVDRMRTHGDPATFISANGTMLLMMAFVALVLRPIVSTAHDFIKNQLMAASFTSRVVRRESALSPERSGSYGFSSECTRRRR